jgi:hypothetical protein
LKVVDELAENSLTRGLTAAEVRAVLGEQERFPWAVLSGHGGQFEEQGEEWRCECRVEAYSAHSSYPRDKDRVGRCVQNLNMEFVDHLGKFPEWLKGSLGEHKKWFNHSLFTEVQKHFQRSSTSVTLES